MIMDSIFRRSVREGRNVRIVSICQHPHILLADCGREEIDGPKDIWLLVGGPGLVWMTI